MNESIQAKRNRFSFGFYFLIILGGIVLDQAIKFFLVKEPFRNYHFAFSLPVPAPVMYMVYAIVLGLVLFYLVNKFSEMERGRKIAWCMIVSGAVSNIGERIALGYVRDFIPLLGGVLNVADLLIFAGIALLLYWELVPGLRNRKL